MDPLQGGIAPTRKYYIKHWMRYVHKFIESSGFNNSLMLTSPLITSLQFLEHQIQVKNILQKYYMFFIYDVGYLKHNVTYILYRFKGYGQISFDTFYKIIKPSSKLEHRVWYFRLIIVLRLRIIIHRLRVHELYGSCNQNVTISSQENTTKNEILFCGDYSEFYSYPPEKQVYFNLFYGSAPYFHLDITFDIISAGVIENYLFPPQCKIKYQAVYNIKISSVLLYIYHIKVPKFQQLYVRTNNLLKGILFNGPGYLSKMKTIVGNVSVHAIPGFQCILKFEHHNLRLQNDNCTVTYSAAARYSNSSIIHDVAQTFQYSKAHSLSTHPYTLMLNSQEETKIFIKISEFSFNVTEDDVDCKYGGISFFDVKENEMHETVSVCTQRAEDQQNLQNYYSDSNKTIVVMYSYPEYSSLSSLLHVSVTHCNIVKINVCAIEIACKSSLKQCSTIWKNELVKISKDYRVWLNIQPGHERCTVLQFLNNPLYEFPFFALMEAKSFICTLFFYIENLIVPITYQYDISGYLSNYDRYWTRSISYQSFSAHGSAYKSDSRHSISHENKVAFFGKDRKGILLFVHDERKARKANIPIKVTLQEKMPPQENSIKFKIKLTKWISWIDFHIKQSNITAFYSDRVRLRSTIQTIDRIFADKLLKITMNSEDLDKNGTELTITIETQVGICHTTLQYINLSERLKGHLSEVGGMATLTLE